MAFLRKWRNGAVIAVFCLCAAGQSQQGIPPRATPADYQTHAQAGNVTIAAEFTGHSIPTPEGPLTTEDYVAVETAFFGPAGTRLKLSTDDFSIRINGKKPSPQQPYGMVIGNLKDPEWAPPVPAGSKSKTSINGSGNSQDGPPPPVKIPIEVQRAMAQRTQKATLPEGDRSLPIAGLIYFQYRGKPEGIRSIELTYAGPAGKATLNLQP